MGAMTNTNLPTSRHRLAFYSAAVLGNSRVARAFHYGRAQQPYGQNDYATDLHTNVPRTGESGLPKGWTLGVDKVWLTSNVDNAFLEVAEIVLRRGACERGELLVPLSIVERQERGALLEGAADFDLRENEPFWAELTWPQWPDGIQVTKAPNMDPVINYLDGVDEPILKSTKRGLWDVARQGLEQPAAWIVLMGEGETLIV